MTKPELVKVLNAIGWIGDETWEGWDLDELIEIYEASLRAERLIEGEDR
jgi:hypothetical protein